MNEGDLVRIKASAHSQAAGMSGKVVGVKEGPWPYRVLVNDLLGVLHFAPHEVERRRQ